MVPEIAVHFACLNLDNAGSSKHIFCGRFFCSCLNQAQPFWQAAARRSNFQVEWKRLAPLTTNQGAKKWNRRRSATSVRSKLSTTSVRPMQEVLSIYQFSIGLRVMKISQADQSGVSTSEVVRLLIEFVVSPRLCKSRAWTSEKYMITHGPIYIEHTYSSKSSNTCIPLVQLVQYLYTTSNYPSLYV